MARVFRPQSAASMRNELLKLLAHAIHFDGLGEQDPAERRDVLAFVVQILDELEESVASTASAWEKRGYWVKADRFSMEWSWVSPAKQRLARTMVDMAIPASDVLYQNLMRRLDSITVPTRMLSTKPWIGAWKDAGAATKPPGDP